MEKKQRNSSIELYRIMLMLGIVTLHVLCSAGLGFTPLARWVMFCVDGFVFISGWYGIKFGWKKVFRLCGLALWCSLVCAMVHWLMFDDPPKSVLALVSNVIRNAESYWFLNAYIVLMCLAPIVDAALESGKSRKLFIPILLVIFGWSFACMIPGLKAWVPTATGFGSHTFFTLLGVYIVARIARLDHWDERFTTKQLVLALAVLSLLAFCNLNKYNSPVAVLLGGVLFMLFNRINLTWGGGHSMLITLINIIAPSMLAVYFLHSGSFDLIRKMVSWFSNSWLAAGVTIAVVFAVCVVVDLLRRACLTIVSRGEREKLK